MTSGLDTSVVVRLLVGTPKAQAELAWRHLHHCRAMGRPAHISALVVAEAFFVLQHHYNVPLGTTLKQLTALLGDACVSADSTTLKVLQMSGLDTAKPEFVDRLIHAHYQTQGHALVTFDKFAARLPKARLLAD